MRIAILHGSNDFYGASKVLLDEVAVLVAAGHEVDIVVPMSGPLASLLAHHGAAVSVHVDESLCVLRRSSLKDAFRALRLPTAARHADVVVLWTIALVMYAPLLRMARRPFYLSVHEVLDGALVATLVHALVAPFGFPVQACSRAARAWLVARGVDPARIKVAYPVLESSPAGGGTAGGRKESELRIAVVGRVNGLKGHGDVADAFQTELLGTRPWRLNLYGGPFPGQEEAVDRLRSQCASDPRITYHGEVQGFGNIARDNDLVASFPPRPESFGLVPIEAWTHGMPSVGWAMGGAAEVLELVGGLGLPRGDGTSAEIAGGLLLAGDKWTNGWDLPPAEAVLPRFTMERRRATVEKLLAEARGMGR